MLLKLHRLEQLKLYLKRISLTLFLRTVCPVRVRLLCEELRVLMQPKKNITYRYVSSVAIDNKISRSDNKDEDNYIIFNLYNIIDT